MSHALNENRLPRVLSCEELEAKLCLSGLDFAEPEIVASEMSDDGSLFNSYVYVSSGVTEGGQIVWHENTGVATFGPQDVSPVVADLNGDGLDDILSASSHKIVWYENTGHRTFGPPHVIAAEVNGPISMLAADVNGDGDLDVIAAFSGQIVWYENTNGHGTFGLPHIIATGVGDVPSLEALDLDGDGKPDLLIAGAERFAWDTIGDGDGILEPYRELPSGNGGAGPDSSIDPSNPTLPPVGRPFVPGGVTGDQSGYDPSPEVPPANPPGGDSIPADNDGAPLDASLADDAFGIERKTGSDTTPDTSPSMPFDERMLGDRDLDPSSSNCGPLGCPVSPSGATSYGSEAALSNFGGTDTFKQMMAAGLRKNLYGGNAADPNNDGNADVQPASRGDVPRHERTFTPERRTTGSEAAGVRSTELERGGNLGRYGNTDKIASRPVMIAGDNSTAPSPSDAGEHREIAEPTDVPPQAVERTDDPARRGASDPRDFTDTVPTEPGTAEATETPQSLPEADISAEPVGQESPGILSRVLAGLIAAGGALWFGSWWRQRARGSVTVRSHGSRTSRVRKPFGLFRKSPVARRPDAKESSDVARHQS